MLDVRSPLATTLEAAVPAASTETAPTVPMPSSVPCVRVMPVVTATELSCANLAALPSMVIPLLLLMEPAPPIFRVPFVTFVAPV